MVDVLIVSSPDDVHAQAVAIRIEQRGKTALILDSLWHENERFSYAINNEFDELSWDLNKVSPKSIWWRRAHFPSSDSHNQQVREFVRAEKRSALFGGLYAFSCPIINNPSREAAANYKPYQLKMAKSLGLTIPHTIITNDYPAMIAFRDQCHSRSSRCVFKSLTPCPTHMGETRLLTDTVDPEELLLAPVIFQECIERGRDIRVFIANSKVFAVEVVTNHHELIDWRLDPICTYIPISLPAKLSEKLILLLDKLELYTASIDLRSDKNGNIFFLEVNPSGQFLFLESDAGLPVTNEFATLLLNCS